MLILFSITLNIPVSPLQSNIDKQSNRQKIKVQAVYNK